MNTLSKEQIEHMIQRFLQWKLPETFNPDGGISFEKFSNKGTPYEYEHKPVGTNLFDYVEAKSMVEYMLNELPNNPTDMDVDAALDTFYGSDKVYTIAELESNRKRMRKVLEMKQTAIEKRT